MSGDQPADGTSSMAEELAGMPVVWRKLLAAHVPDRLGRCAGCATASGSGQRWPCSLRRVAEDAERIYGLELGRAVGEAVGE